MLVERDKAIGVFDSGVGGLTVLDALQEALPAERLVYLGDTARVPYGNKGPATIVRYAVACAKVLMARDIKALVVACNTASAFALEALTQLLPVPVIGVIEPVAAVAAKVSVSGVVGVIGTRGTVTSDAYGHALRRHRPALTVLQAACPLFVPLAEEGWSDDDVTHRVARRYLQPLTATAMDTLILGCTHYPLLQPTLAAVLREAMAHPVTLCDSATATAELTQQTLVEHALLRHGATEAVQFLVTDDPEHFVEVGRLFLRNPPGRAEHIDW